MRFQLHVVRKSNPPIIFDGGLSTTLLYFLYRYGVVNRLAGVCSELLGGAILPTGYYSPIGINRIRN